MSTNKIIVYVTIFAVALLIIIPTGYKVFKNNREKLYLVNEKKVTEAALKCYLEKKCPEKKITLNELYDNKYLLEDIIDPVQKIVYDENSYVELKKEGSTFTIVD